MRVLAALPEKVSPRDLPCRDASPSSATSICLARAGHLRESKKGTGKSYSLYENLSFSYPPKT